MYNRETDTEESFRKKAIWGSAAVVAIAAGAFAWYYHHSSQPAPVEKTEAVHPQATQPATPEDVIRNPVPQTANTEAPPLPALNDSDPNAREAFSGLLGAKAFDQFLIPENLVRHIVVTVDNLPRKKVAVELRPIKATPGQAVVSSQGDITTLSVDNSARYAPIMRLVQSTDAQSLAQVYFRLYPLFQQAYEDLGYPGKYFNDRLVEVIDHLLEAPEIAGPIELVQPKVFYQFADQGLEDRSAGQKLLIRMGTANERAIKAKLRELRAAIVSKSQ